MTRNKKALYKMILTAIFSALCFVGVNIRVPLPFGFIHLGNFICIMAALLCGGIVGGISGSIGMGLFDLYYYGGFTAGVLRTILLKFCMGLIAGVAFRYFSKKKKNPKYLNIGLCVLFIILFSLSVAGCCLGGFDFMGTHIQLHYTVPVFLGILVVLYVCIIIFDKRLELIAKIALTSTSLAILFNIFGEIYIKALLYYWIETKYTTFEQAYVYAMSGIVSVSITSIVTCLLSGFIFYPLYRSIQPFLQDK